MKYIVTENMFLMVRCTFKSELVLFNAWHLINNDIVHWRIDASQNLGDSIIVPSYIKALLVMRNASIYSM